MSHTCRNIIVIVVAGLALAACERPGSTTTSPVATAAVAVTPVAANTLEMRIDGTPWRADHDIFGAFHPLGYDRALIVGGSLGPKDANEQAFTLNLYGIDGPGRYAFRNGNAAGHVVQIANLSSERYLAGSILGFDFTIDVSVASKLPTVIEATFSGTLESNDGATLTISDGQFSYRE